jgi:hypothetical protein
MILVKTIYPPPHLSDVLDLTIAEMEMLCYFLVKAGSAPGSETMP